MSWTTSCSRLKSGWRGARCPGRRGSRVPAVQQLVRLFLAVKRHEIAKATEHARDHTADDWTDRVDVFEVAELFEFL